MIQFFTRPVVPLQISSHDPPMIRPCAAGHAQRLSLHVAFLLGIQKAPNLLRRLQALSVMRMGNHSPKWEQQGSCGDNHVYITIENYWHTVGIIMFIDMFNYYTGIVGIHGMFSSEARDFDLVQNYRGPGRVWVPEQVGNLEMMRIRDIKM